MADTKANWDDCLQYARRSDVGMRRANNQDNLNVVLASGEEDWRSRGHMFIVADGMGGHAAGELASKLAVDAIPHNYLKYRDLRPAEALRKAVTEANAEVHRRGQANIDFHNMGTTASVLVLVPQGALVGHVGDSRVYRMRGERLEQLTFDHSLLWELRAAGQISPDGDLASSIPKNQITRSLGPSPTVQVDIEGPFPLQVGDTFLICSDGLSGEVPDEEIGPILASLSPDEAARVLVDLANLRGGPDNVTVVIARVTGDRLMAEQETTAPVRLGEPSFAARIHPALWIIMGVCFLAAVTMLVVASPWAAAVAGAGGVVTLGIVLWQAFRPRPGGDALGDGRTLGKAPYVSIACPANQKFLQKLSGIVEELRDAAIDRDWNVDWETFDGYCRRAEESAQRKQTDAAVGEYARAVSFMMDELRSQNARKASDSAIDY